MLISSKSKEHLLVELDLVILTIQQIFDSFLMLIHY